MPRLSVWAIMPFQMSSEHSCISTHAHPSHSPSELKGSYCLQGSAYNVDSTVLLSTSAMHRLHKRFDSCWGLKASVARRRSISLTNADVMAGFRCRNEAYVHRMLLTCCRDSSCTYKFSLYKATLKEAHVSIHTERSACQLYAGCPMKLAITCTIAVACAEMASSSSSWKCDSLPIAHARLACTAATTSAQIHQCKWLFANTIVFPSALERTLRSDCRTRFCWLNSSILRFASPAKVSMTVAS